MCVRSWQVNKCGCGTRRSVWHDSLFYVTWLIVMRVRFGQVINSRRALWMCVWHDSSSCVTWLIIMCDMTHRSVWHGIFFCVSDLDKTITTDALWMCVTWLIIMCDMTHRSVWHVIFFCVSDLGKTKTTDAHFDPATIRCVWHDSSSCVTRLIVLCDMTYYSVCQIWARQ